MRIDVKKIIKQLSKEEYPLFTHESDFQNKFILELNKQLTHNQFLFSEYPWNKKRLDLVILDKNNKTYSVIEFKYVIRKAEINIPGGIIKNLRSSYNSSKRKQACKNDINRLKNLNLNIPDSRGRSNQYKKGQCYFILLTNIDKFQKDFPGKYETYFQDFKYLIKEI